MGRYSLRKDHTFGGYILEWESPQGWIEISHPPTVRMAYIQKHAHLDMLEGRKQRERRRKVRSRGRVRLPPRQMKLFKNPLSPADHDKVFIWIYKRTIESMGPQSDRVKETAFDEVVAYWQSLNWHSLPDGWEGKLGAAIRGRFAGALKRESEEARRATSFDQQLGSEGEGLTLGEVLSAEAIVTDVEVLGEEEQALRRIMASEVGIGEIKGWMQEFLGSEAGVLFLAQRKVLGWVVGENLSYRVIAKRLPAFLAYTEAQARCGGPPKATATLKERSYDRARERRRRKGVANPADTYFKAGKKLYQAATAVIIEASDLPPRKGTGHFIKLWEGLKLYTEALAYFLVACGQSPHTARFFAFTQKDIATLYETGIERFRATYAVPEEYRTFYQRNPHDDTDDY